MASIPGSNRGKWQPTPVFLPEKSHQRSLAGCRQSRRGLKESDTTELTEHTHCSFQESSAHMTAPNTWKSGDPWKSDANFIKVLPGIGVQLIPYGRSFDLVWCSLSIYYPPKEIKHNKDKLGICFGFKCKGFGYKIAFSCRISFSFLFFFFCDRAAFVWSRNHWTTRKTPL